jgi:preprotein translocase subunit SecA
VVPVPTNKPIARKDRNDLIFQTAKGKYEAIIRKVKEVNKTGQPILIGTASIDTNESLSKALTAAGVVHEMLNAKNHEREGEIIAEAGKKGRVTLATNMAGRGVDIKLGGTHATEAERAEVLQLGGLFVLGTERHEARRIDNQLRGRAGRQGDAGETQFFVSMEDQLMRVFGGDKIKGLMGTFGIPEDQPIENKMISRQLEGAQSRIEGFHFDSRKQVLAYDNVLNQQRQVIYERRSKLLLGSHEEVESVVTEVMGISEEAQAAVLKKKAECTEEEWSDLMRRLALQVIDTLWVEHLEVMASTRSSVNLRAYGQRDPLIEYRKEGLRLFKEMQEVTLYRIAEIVPRLQNEALRKEEELLTKARKAAQESAEGETSVTQGKSEPRSVGESIGRNELVTITDGNTTQTLKYKKAQTLIEEGGWKIVGK